MDYFAVATLGVFPTPTPAVRSVFLASWGLLDSIDITVSTGFGGFKMHFTMRF